MYLLPNSIIKCQYLLVLPNYLVSTKYDTGLVRRQTWYSIPKVGKLIRTLIWKHGIVQNLVDLQIRLRAALAEVVYELSC